MLASSLAHALERTPSNAWARKTPALTRPITAVTASNIAKFLCAPAHQTMGPLHSQKDSLWGFKVGAD